MSEAVKTKTESWFGARRQNDGFIPAKRMGGHNIEHSRGISCSSLICLCGCQSVA